MSCLGTGFTVRAKAARAEAARTSRAVPARVVQTKKAARENPTFCS